MSQIQELHQQAMNLAEAAAVARLRGALEQAAHLTRQALEQETHAASLTTNSLESGVFKGCGRSLKEKGMREFSYP
jgi:hypothetical protein